MEKADNTTISISKDTRDRLREIGNMTENYDDVINRILNLVEKQK